jgi:hypothetical protein
LLQKSGIVTTDFDPLLATEAKRLEFIPSFASVISIWFKQPAEPTDLSLAVEDLRQIPPISKEIKTAEPSPIASLDHRDGNYLKNNLITSKATVSLFTGPHSYTDLPIRIGPLVSTETRKISPDPASIDLLSQPRVNQRDLDPSIFNNFVDVFLSDHDGPSILDSAGVLLAYSQADGPPSGSLGRLSSVSHDIFGKSKITDKHADFCSLEDIKRLHKELVSIFLFLC